MNITTRAYYSLFEVTVESGNTKIVEDVAAGIGHLAKVPDDEINEFISVAYEASRFNGTSDIDFVRNIYDLYLSDTEKQELIELLTQKD